MDAGSADQTMKANAVFDLFANANLFGTGMGHSIRLSRGCHRMSRRYLAYTNDNEWAPSKVARSLNNIRGMGEPHRAAFWRVANSIDGHNRGRALA
jgi:hypothetical protein